MKLAFDLLAHVVAVIGPAWMAFYSDLTWVRVVLSASAAVAVIHMWQWLRRITTHRGITELP